MSKEELQKVLYAFYLEHKPIQFWDKTLEKWADIKRPSWCEEIEYRVKPEGWQPYTLESFQVDLYKHQCVKIKGETTMRFVPVYFDAEGIVIQTRNLSTFISYKDLFAHYEWENKCKCGINNE